MYLYSNFEVVIVSVGMTMHIIYTSDSSSFYLDSLVASSVQFVLVHGSGSEATMTVTALAYGKA